MKRKGQVIIEFFFTYGWAILLVLACIGALAYFGVLDPCRYDAPCEEETGYQKTLLNHTVFGLEYYSCEKLLFAINHDYSVVSNISFHNKTYNGKDAGVEQRRQFYDSDDLKQEYWNRCIA